MRPRVGSRSSGRITTVPRTNAGLFPDPTPGNAITAEGSSSALQLNSCSSGGNGRQQPIILERNRPRTPERMSVKQFQRPGDLLRVSDPASGGPRASHAKHLLYSMVCDLPRIVQAERDLHAQTSQHGHLHVQAEHTAHGHIPYESASCRRRESFRSILQMRSQSPNTKGTPRCSDWHL